MLTLINANRMVPPIAPVGLDYVAGATRRAGIDTELLDPCLCNVPDTSLASYFDRRQPELVGISFRNVDDCFWPSAQSFLPVLKQTVDEVRRLTDAPIVLGGVGFSIFAQRIVEYSGVDFGIRGDGERALVELIEQLRGDRRPRHVHGGYRGWIVGQEPLPSGWTVKMRASVRRVVPETIVVTAAPLPTSSRAWTAQ